MAKTNKPSAFYKAAKTSAKKTLVGGSPGSHRKVADGVAKTYSKDKEAWSKRKDAVKTRKSTKAQAKK